MVRSVIPSKKALACCSNSTFQFTTNEYPAHGARNTAAANAGEPLSKKNSISVGVPEITRSQVGAVRNM